MALLSDEDVGLGSSPAKPSRALSPAWAEVGVPGGVIPAGRRQEQKDFAGRLIKAEEQGGAGFPATRTVIAGSEAPAPSTAKPGLLSDADVGLGGSAATAPGKSKDPLAETKGQIALDVVMQRLSRAGGEAAAIADLVLGTPYFLLQTGAKLGGAAVSALAGEKDPFKAGRETAERLQNVPILRKGDTPLKHLIDSFSSGEAYKDALTTQGMEKLSKGLEEAGKWVEETTGGRIPRDAVPMFVETVMAGSAGLFGGKRQPIDSRMQKLLRENAQKLRDQAEVESVAAAEAARTPESAIVQASRVPVQQQINQLLDIKTPAERAAQVRARRKDVKAAFEKPAEGSDYVDIAESQFRAAERMENEARYGRPTEGVVEPAGTAYEVGSSPRPERVGQAEVLRILQKPGFERTAEDLITLRKANQEGKASPEALALMGAAGLGAVVGDALTDDDLRGAALGAVTGAAAAAPFMFRGPSVPGMRRQAGAVKAPGGMWHPEAVERLSNPLTKALTRNLAQEQGLLDPVLGAESPPFVEAVRPFKEHSDRMVKTYLNRYAGTERDPLKDVEIPFGEGVKRWEEVTDKAIIGEERRGPKGPETEWNLPPAGNVVSRPKRVPAEMLVAIRDSRNALTSYLSHVGDYLRQNVDPAKLPQYDLVRAVKETYQNDLRVAKEMEKAAADSTAQLPVYKAYPNGYKWVELKEPEALTPEQAKRIRPATEAELDFKAGEGPRKLPSLREQGYSLVALDHQGKPIVNSYTGQLAGGPDATKAYLSGITSQEGNIMGHCVGLHCKSVWEGESKLYSLRDAKGQSHVTIEVIPEQAGPEGEGRYNPVTDTYHGAAGPEITQIKGKQNRAPNAEYLPYVQDFVKEGPTPRVEKGYRSAQSGQGGFGNTEGNGIYLAKKPELARFFGENTQEVSYQKPKKTLKVDEEPLYLLQELPGLDEPIRPTDSAWTKANKEAFKRAAEKYGVTEQNWKPDLIGNELTQVLKEKGYDAIDVTSGGKSWVVLLDPELTKPSRWGEVGDLANTGMARVSDFKPEVQARLREKYRDVAYLPTEQIDAVIQDLPVGSTLRRGQEGFIDQKLLTGLGAVGLGGLLGSFLAEDSLDGLLLGSIAGSALAIPSSRAVLKAGLAKADKYLGLTSTQIMERAPQIHRRLLDYEMDWRVKTHDELTKATSWMKASVALPAADRAALNSALLNNDSAAILAVTQKYPQLAKGWRETTQMWRSLGERAQERGRFKELLDDHFPRRVKDYKGLMAKLDQPVSSRIQERLQEAQRASQRNRGMGLTEVERDVIINRELRSQFRQKTYQPGYAKARTVKEVTSELEPFYYSPQEGLVISVGEVVKDLELAKLFGRDAVESQKGNRRYLNIDQSIGNLLGREMVEGRLKPDDIDFVEDLIKNRFGPGEMSPDGWLQNLRNVTYAGLLANPVSALTQLGDPLIASRRYGLRSTLTAVARLASGKPKITMKDFALADHIAEDLAWGLSEAGSKKAKLATAAGATVGAITGAVLQDDLIGALPGAAAGAFLGYMGVAGSASALRRAMATSVFKGIDQFGGNVNLGAALDSYTRMSHKPAGVKELIRRYGDAYGSDMPQLLADLQKGQITPLVRSLAFAELSHMRPTSMLEAPPAYAKNPNGRIMWQLKLFMLKQLDIGRREAINEMKKGDSKSVARGLKNMATLLAIWGLAGATPELLKNIVLGREVGDLDVESVAENVLKTFGFAKYVRERMGNDPVLAPLGTLVPAPAQMMDTIIARDPKAVKHIPVIGKLYYDWELGGQEEAEINQKRREKKEGFQRDLSPAAEAFLERRREEAKRRREALQ